MRPSTLKFVSFAFFATPSLIAAAPRVAHAEESIAVAEARRHYQTGVGFYNEGDYKLALVEFEKAYELHPNVRVLYNIGQVQYQLNRYSRALRAFRRYLDEGGAEVPEDRRKAVETDVEALKSRVAQLSVSSNAEGAEVRVDDEVIGVTPVRGAWVDIGTHMVTVARDGFKPKSQQLSLAGRDVRDLDVLLQKDEGKVIIERNTGLPAYVWVSWSATAAFGVGTLVTGLLANSASSDLAKEIAKVPNSRTAITSAEDKKDNLTIATIVLGGATVAAAGLSTYFTISATRKPSEPGKPAEKAATLSVTPTLGGILLNGQF